MNAKEFVKKYGWFGAKEYLAGATFLDNHLIVMTNNDDLKTLVDAYELVKDIGGLAKAKEYADSPYTAPEISEPLKQAIKLVESVDE